MKKLLLLAALFVGTLSAFADDSNYITGKLTVDDDLNGATLAVNLTNTTSYVAFQMDIAFPEEYTITASAEGISYTRADAKGTVTINGSEQTSAFTLAYNVLSDDHTIRIIGYNLGNVAIAGTSGDELFTVSVSADATAQGCAAADEWTATFSNVIFVTSDDLAETTLTLYSDGTEVADQTLSGEVAESWIMGDVNHDGLVDVNDITATIKKTLSKEVDPFYEAQADVNSDGTIDVNDVTGIIKLSLGKSL